MSVEVKNAKARLLKNLKILALIIFLSLLFEKLGLFYFIFHKFKNLGLFASFVAGMLYTSVFSGAVALVLLIELAKVLPIWQVVLFGGIGCTVADFLMVKFLRDRFSDDIIILLENKFGNIWKKTKRVNLLKIISFFIGAVVVSSPLPDELGLTLMGFSGVKNKFFVPATFFLNIVGIYFVCSIF